MAGFVIKMSILVPNINQCGAKDLSSKVRHKAYASRKLLRRITYCIKKRMEEQKDFLSEYGFSIEVQEQFSSIGKEMVIKKGEKLLEQGKVCSFVALIISGRFRIYHEYDGKESTIGLSFENFISDYSSFVAGKPSEVNIKALTECKLLVLEKEEVEVFFDFNKETQLFGRKIAEQIMVSNQDILFSLLYNTAEQRYKKIIAQYPHLLQKFSLKDIAECIGVTPETVSRIRKKILNS